MSGDRPAGALEGIRVIDLTQMLAGPFCTQMLADHGAEVIKIESPEGDHSRTLGPFRADDEKRQIGGYFASTNRNKKSVVIDLKQPDAPALLRRLIASADAVVENFRAGIMDRFGLSYESLREDNPKLVYAAIRGFGDPRTGKSPYVDWPAFDVVAQAMGGMIGITGSDAATVTKAGPGVGDIIPGIMAAFGIVSAILRSKTTGRGQFVDVAMVDAILATCERIVHQYSFAGTIPGPEGNRHPILSPFGIFPAKDGFVTVAAPVDTWWRALCVLIGREDLRDDPRTRTNELRAVHRDLVHGAVEEFTCRHSKAELGAILGGKVPFGPIYKVDEIFADPHFAVRDMLVEVEDPGSAEPVRIAGIPVHMTETPGTIRSRPPLLGEHTDTVLAAYGFSARRDRRPAPAQDRPVMQGFGDDGSRQSRHCRWVIPRISGDNS